MASSKNLNTHRINFPKDEDLTYENEVKPKTIKSKIMTDKSIFDEAFPQDKQVGGTHYKEFPIQPYEFISKNNLSFFQGCVVKYVCRYLFKGTAIQDLEKVIHYCELEIKKLKDTKKT